MGQIHELNTESNVGVGLDFVTDNGESTGKVGFAALAGAVLEKYGETELAGERRSAKQAIDDLAQQVDDAVEDVAALKKAGSGLTDEAKQALLTCFRNVAWINDQGQSYYDALEDALYPPIRAASITLNTDTVKLKTLGATQQLTATVLPADATDKVVWASSDTSVTTVVDGLVTSVAYGSATITATAGDVSASASVLVAQAEVTGIIAVFEQGGATIYDTASLDDLKPMLTVTASYDDGTSQTVTDYTLSGTLTEGTSVVTVSYGGKTATFNVTVTHAVSDTSPVITDTNKYLSNNGVPTSGTGCSCTDYYVIKGSSVTISLPYTEDSVPRSSVNMVAFNDTTKTHYWNAYNNLSTEKTIDISVASNDSNNIRFTLFTSGLASCYAYDTSSGDIYFAGLNSPYYGMSNISEAS